MRTTWDPAVSDRYAVWFEAERQASIAARLVVYDTVTGRRWTDGDVGSVRSYPALSGSLAVWCSAVSWGSRASWAPGSPGGGQFIPIADGDGAPVVSGNLVVWARSWTGPFVAASSRAVRLAGLRLADRRRAHRPRALRPHARVGAAGQRERLRRGRRRDVDGGGRQMLASGVTGLAGPSYDGKTVAWSETTAPAAA